MKKNVLVLLFVALTTITVSAQSGEGFAKGDVFVSGALMLDSRKNDNVDTGNYKYSEFTITPSLGYFVTENIAIGGSVAYVSQKFTQNEGDVEQEINALALGIMGRYYMTPADKFSLFGQLSAAYTTAESGAIKANGFSSGLGLGMNYFVASNWAIEAGLGILSYASAKADVPNADESTNLNFGFDLSQISFGVNYKF